LSSERRRGEEEMKGCNNSDKRGRQNRVWLGKRQGDVGRKQNNKE
jgi:hypothetical protein